MQTFFLHMLSEMAIGKETFFFSHLTVDFPSVHSSNSFSTVSIYLSNPLLINISSVPGAKRDTPRPARQLGQALAVTSGSRGRGKHTRLNPNPKPVSTSVLHPSPTWHPWLITLCLWDILPAELLGRVELIWMEALGS